MPSQQSHILPADVALLGWKWGSGLATGHVPVTLQAAGRLREKAPTPFPTHSLPEAQLPPPTAAAPQRYSLGPVSTSGPTLELRCSVSIPSLLLLDFAAVKSAAADNRNEVHLPARCSSPFGERFYVFVPLGQRGQVHWSKSHRLCPSERAARQLPATVGRQVYW